MFNFLQNTEISHGREKENPNVGIQFRLSKEVAMEEINWCINNLRELK